MSLGTSARRLRKQVRDPRCHLCPLHETAQYVCLTGDGQVPNKAMMVGEAPGVREEEESKPFVGKAGQYLDEVMEKRGLPRRKVFISNVVKCRPPGNRTPKTREIKACLPFLEEEIRRVNPTYIMAMGNPALKALTGKTGTTKLMGSWLDAKPAFGKRKIFACMHPSGVLRQEFYKSKFEFAIQQFSNITQDNVSSIKTDYRLVTTKELFRKATADIKAADIVAWDIENSKGFNPWNGGRILTIAFATRPGKAWVFPIEHPQMKVRGLKKIFRVLKEILEAEHPKKVPHNGKYERKWMIHHSIYPRMDFDTMIAAYLLDENGPMGLGPLARALCQAPDWKEDTDFSKGIPSLKKLWLRNAGDADYTLRLYLIKRKRINALPELARLMKFLMLPAADLLAEVEHQGMVIDRKRLNKRALLCERKLWKIRRRLRKHLPRKRVERNRKGQDCVRDKDFGLMPINWNSTKFLGWFLYKHLGLPLLEITKTGKAGTREAILMQIKDKHQAVAQILELREWTGRQSKFINSWIELAIEHEDGALRLHTNYNLTKTDRGQGTETGRLSSTDPNMQQVPRESFIRAMVTASPGWKLGQADLEQAELRIAAWQADETNMKQKFIDGEDIHRATACDVTGLKPEEVDKETRKKAKAINFGFLYGMYPKKFQIYALEKYQTVVTLAEAKEARNKYFNAYPKLLDWHERVRRRVASAGYVKSPLGRRRRLPHIHSMDNKLRQQAERQAINAPVQATASDFTLFAGILLRRRLPKSIFRIVGFVHDAILFEYKKKYEDKVCSTVKKTMENLPLKRYFGVTVPVPIEVKIDIGTHWSEGKTWTRER